MTNEEIYLYKKAQNGGGSSVINEINGVFIDTNNVIDSGSYNPSNPLNYTATEDCVALITLISQSNHCYVYVDNINIYHLYTDNTTSMNLFVPLKKGQVLTASTAFSAESSGYAVYGIQQGSQDTTKNEIYSTEERAVGTWIDGRPIYQKTYVFETAKDLSIGWNSLFAKGEGELIIDIIISAFVINEDGIYFPVGGASNDSTYIEANNMTQTVINGVKYFTIQYTKSTT